MPHGSPFWQGVIFLCAILFLLFETWRGWRAGLIRSGLNLASIVVSALVLYFGGQIAAAPFGGMGTTTGFITGFVVGGGLAFVVFAIIWLLGALLFKRTEHQGSGIIRFFWGMGGAVFGLLLGLFLLWGGISIIRMLGVLAETRLSPSVAQESPARNPALSNQPAPPPGRPQKLAEGLVTLKKSLELGPAGQFVESVDVIPPDLYDLLLQVGQVTSNQEAMVRFIQYPGVQKVMQNPRLVELFNDPSVIKAAEQRNVVALMGNKALFKALEDPVLAEELKQIDLRAALKFALETSPPSHSPSPKSSP